MELGPSEQNRIVRNPSLTDFITECNQYVGKLALFKRYIVWRYTIGSASINYRLIFGSLSPNTPYWVFLFFKYFKNTVFGLTGKAVNKTHLQPPFYKFLKFFNDPGSYSKLDTNTKSNVTEEIMKLYDAMLMSILKDSPTVRGNGFDVYKVSSYYPALPDINNFEPTLVEQMPFNSVTVNNQFNFEPFVAKDKDSFIFKINIPGKTKGILYVPTDLHAYSFEHEIILPYGIKFFIESFKVENINYIPPTDVNVDLVQDKNNTMMGNTYVLNEYAPCNGIGCHISKKPMVVFNSKYII